MGRYTEEELQKLKRYIELNMSNIKIDSLSSLILSVIFLGQYFQYTFVSYTDGKFNSGTGVVENLKPNTVYSLLSKCRNYIIHYKSKELLIEYVTQLRNMLSAYNYNSSEFRELPKCIQSTLIDLSNINHLWDDLLAMYEGIDKMELSGEIDPLFDFCSQGIEFEDISDEDNFLSGASPISTEYEVNKSVWRESSVKEISKLYDKSLIESLMEFSRYEGDHEFNWGCHTGFYYIYGIQGKSNIPEVIYVKATTDDELKTEAHFDNLRSNLEISTEEYSDRLDSTIILSFGNAKEEQCAVLVRLGKVYINDGDFKFNLYERDNYEDDEDDFLSGASFISGV